jgi:hypothetical protein
MATPAVLVENLFSTIQFPSHVVAAEEAASGYEAFRVANGRRSVADYWTPTTADSDTWIKATCNTVRAANGFALDRGHNLAGYTVALQVSNDDFTTYETAFSGVLPSVSAPGAFGDALGVRTEEGAWLHRFDLRAGYYWRLFVPAMGASLLPRVVGLWVGLILDLEYLDRPYQDDQDDLVMAGVESDMGWTGTGRVTQRRAGELRIALHSYADYDLVRYHLQGHYGARRPTWIVHNQDQADQAVLGIRPEGELGFGYDRDWGYRRGVLRYVEHEPRAA